MFDNSKKLRNSVTFAFVLLTMAPAFAQPSDLAMGRREQAAEMISRLQETAPRIPGESEADRYNRLEDQVHMLMRPIWEAQDRADQPATPDNIDATKLWAEPSRDAQFQYMLAHIRRMMPRTIYGSDVAFEARANVLTNQAIRTLWNSLDEIERTEAMYQQRMRQSLYPQTLGAYSAEQERKLRSERERLMRNTRQMLIWAEKYISEDKARFEQDQQYADWKRTNPEEAARRERLAEAQQRRAAHNEARLLGWQIVHFRENVCQPIEDAFPQAKDPDDILRVMQTSDRDAGYQPGAEWRQTDQTGRTVTRGWAAIEHSGGIISLALSYQGCNGLIRAVRGR